jgi:hypothetical protein
MPARIRSFDELRDYLKVRCRQPSDTRDTSKAAARSNPKPAAAAPQPMPPDAPHESMIGDVYSVPNTHWGFERTGSYDHPGICMLIGLNPSSHVYLSKGTDAHHIRVRYRSEYFLVDPDIHNGLSKLTAFLRQEIAMAFRRVRLYYPERHLGHIDSARLIELTAGAIPFFRRGDQ